MTDILLIASLLFVAILYASVGHGGASGYLAVLALFGTQVSFMKSSSLILNIFVSAISFFQFYKGGHFRYKLFLYFAITSIPCAFIGSTFSIDDNTYKKMLGICLIFPILKLLGVFRSKTPSGNVDFNYTEIGFALAIGAFIGLISGMLGIGGGIILSPIILLLGWADMKQTAAISALFILVNSLSGLMGLYGKGIHYDPHIVFWLSAAIIGGSIGAYYGSKKLDNKILKYILAVVLIIASVKLVLT